MRFNGDRSRKNLYGASVIYPGLVGEEIARVVGEAAGFAVATCDARAVACWVVGIGAGCALDAGFTGEAIAVNSSYYHKNCVRMNENVLRVSETHDCCTLY
jgi:hypothetical protein